MSLAPNLVRVLSTAFVAAGLLVVYLANNDERSRYRQAIMPVFALAWIGVGLLALHYWDDPATFIRNLLSKIHLGSLAWIVSDGPLIDLAFLALFAVLKKALNVVIKRSELSGSLPFREQVELFYQFDERKSMWFVKSGYLGLRTLARIAAIVAVVATIAVEYICASTEGLVHVCFAPLILCEISYFLQGPVIEDAVTSDSADHDGARMVFSYAKLEQALRHYFNDRVLSFVSDGGKKVAPEGNIDISTALSASDDPREQLCGAYFTAVIKNGLVGGTSKYDDLVHDYVLNTVDIMKGKSVLFATPFFGDYAPYVALPMNTALLHGKRVLMLTGIEDGIGTLADYCDECISFVTNVPNMWEVSELTADGQSCPDIALLSYQNLDDLSFLDANAAFFAQVSMCVIVDPSSLLSTYQVGLTMLSGLLSEGGTPTYCAFDRNADGLVDALSHALRVNLVEVGATEHSEGVTYGMFWGVDGPQLQNRLMDGVARYLGVGTELALVAIREQVKKVTWVGQKAIPLLDVRWISGQYYAEMFGFAELPQEQAELDRHFEYSISLGMLEREKQRFIVVEDEHNNLFEEYRQLAGRGSAETFVNVLAPNYLLRSYMSNNPNVFSADPKAIPSLAPDVSKSARNVAYSLAMKMMQTGEKICEDEVVRQLRYAGVPFDDPGEVLAHLLIDHFAEVDSETSLAPLVCDVRREYDPVTHEVVSKRYYGLSVAAVDSSSFASLRNVPLITEMPDGTREVVGSRVYDLLYQSWLTGQFLTYEGKYYEVVSENLESGMLLRRAADHFNSRKYYRQLRTYAVTPMPSVKPLPSRSLSGVKITPELARIDVSTRGYLDMNDYGNVLGARRVLLEGVPDRHYKNKKVLRIRLEGADAMVTRTIAVVFSEILATLFPGDHQYLAILCSRGDLPEGILYDSTASIPDNEFLVVEDSSIDIGLLTSVDRNFQRILELCYEYMDWNEEHLHNKDKGPGESIEIGILPEVESQDVPEQSTSTKDDKKKGFFARLLEWFRNLFSKLKRGGQSSETKIQAEETNFFSGGEW